VLNVSVQNVHWKVFNGAESGVFSPLRLLPAVRLFRRRLRCRLDLYEAPAESLLSNE
jgi:hypothetical protein